MSGLDGHGPGLCSREEKKKSCRGESWFFKRRTRLLKSRSFGESSPPLMDRRFREDSLANSQLQMVQHPSSVSAVVVSSNLERWCPRSPFSVLGPSISIEYTVWGSEVKVMQSGAPPRESTLSRSILNSRFRVASPAGSQQKVVQHLSSKD